MSRILSSLPQTLTMLSMYRFLGEDTFKLILNFLPRGFCETIFSEIIMIKARVSLEYTRFLCGTNFIEILKSPSLRYRVQRLCIGDVNCNSSLYIPRSRVQGRILTGSPPMFMMQRALNCFSPFKVTTNGRKHIRVDNEANYEFWLTIDLTEIRFPKEHPIHRHDAKWTANGRVATYSDFGVNKVTIHAFPPWVGAYFTDASFMAIQCNSLACPSFWLHLELQY